MARIGPEPGSLPRGHGGIRVLGVYVKGKQIFRKKVRNHWEGQMVTITVYQAKRYNLLNDDFLIIGWGTLEWIKEQEAAAIEGTAMEVPVHELTPTGRWVDPKDPQASGSEPA